MTLVLGSLVDTESEFSGKLSMKHCAHFRSPRIEGTQIGCAGTGWKIKGKYLLRVPGMEPQHHKNEITTYFFDFVLYKYISLVSIKCVSVQLFYIFTQNISTAVDMT